MVCIINNSFSFMLFILFYHRISLTFTKMIEKITTMTYMRVNLLSKGVGFNFLVRPCPRKDKFNLFYDKI